jgi:hypothetical protein
MDPVYYIGLDVHKRKISHCVKDSGGRVDSEGSLSATRQYGRLPHCIVILLRRSCGQRDCRT